MRVMVAFKIDLCAFSRPFNVKDKVEDVYVLCRNMFGYTLQEIPLLDCFPCTTIFEARKSSPNDDTFVDLVFRILYLMFCLVKLPQRTYMLNISTLLCNIDLSRK